MRVLLGLTALSFAALANAQTMTLSIPSGGVPVAATLTDSNGGTAPAATVNVYSGAVVGLANLLPASAFGGNGILGLNSGAVSTGSSWSITIANTINTLIWSFSINSISAQVQYRFNGCVDANTNLSSLSYLCDPCVNTGTFNAALTAGSSVACNTANGPVGTGGSSPFTGYNCALFTRQYTYAGLLVGSSSFTVQIYGRVVNVVTTYSFSITRQAVAVKGDPQISGLQGQDFQVHGIPDEIFNLVTYPNLQVNARFVYLSSAECHDNYTACFAHPGTYVGEEGIRLGNDKVHIKAGSFKKGLTVSVNGQRVNSGKHQVKLGSIDVVNHRRVVVNTPVVTLTISNSDKFLNQESQLHDKKLLTLGSERRVLADGEQFHPEVPLHGLQGQTWRNVEYPSGLEYEGSINDYHVVDGNLYGTEFVFNQFKL